MNSGLIFCLVVGVVLMLCLIWVLMLYEKLNSFDIDLIRFVVKFISTQKLKNADAGQEETPMIFDFDVAADYPNLNRAMSAFLAENKNAKLA